MNIKHLHFSSQVNTLLNTSGPDRLQPTSSNFTYVPAADCSSEMTLWNSNCEVNGIMTISLSLHYRSSGDEVQGSMEYSVPNFTSQPGDGRLHDNLIILLNKSMKKFLLLMFLNLFMFRYIPLSLNILLLQIHLQRLILLTLRTLLLQDLHQQRTIDLFNR